MTRITFIFIVLLPIASFGQMDSNELLELGKFELENGYVLSAIESFSKAITLDSTCADAYYYRGQAFENSLFEDCSPRATNDYLKCISIDTISNYHRAYSFLSSCSFSDTSITLKYLNKLVFMNPDNVDFLIRRGDFYSNRLHNFNAASNDYNLAVKIDSKNPKVYLARAGFLSYSMLFMQIEYYYEPIKKTFKPYYKNVNDGTMTYYLDENTYYKLIEYHDTIISDLKKALRFDKKDGEIYFLIGIQMSWYNEHIKRVNYCRYFRKAKRLGYDAPYYSTNECYKNKN